LEGLFVESALLVPPAVAWILWLEVRGLGAFLHGPSGIAWLLVAGGVVTSTPLLFFAAAARRIPLNTLGLLQYLAPSLQFLMGVFLFYENFGRVQAGAFALIWAGLALYSMAGLAHRPRHSSRISG
jgi:chloramphenicol-sensitive protein RarD